MIISVLELSFVEGKAEQGFSAIHESLKATRGFAGCLGADVAQDVADANKAIIVERWESLEHDTAYRTWAAGQTAASPLRGLIAAPPTKSIGALRSEV